MIENQKIRPAQVIGPLGEPLTIADLPAPETKRWVVRRKAEVVAAVNGGLLTIDEVLERYNLTLEEFAPEDINITKSIAELVDSVGLAGAILLPPLTDDAALLDLLEAREIPMVSMSPASDTATAAAMLRAHAAICLSRAQR